MNLTEKALEIATRAHNGQFRRDGKTPYISHPVAVSGIVSGWIEGFVSGKKIHYSNFLIRKASNYYNSINTEANVKTFIELFKIISIAHDVFEDSDLFTLTEFRSILENENAGNPEYPDSFFVIIKDSLKLLTHDEKDSYLDYILKIKGDYFASVVKIGDITHNISTRKDINAGDAGKAKLAVDKYRLAEYILLN